MNQSALRKLWYFFRLKSNLYQMFLTLVKICTLWHCLHLLQQTTRTPILNPPSMSIILSQEAEGETTIHKEVEEEAGSITTLSINTLRISINLILSLKGVLNSNRNLMVQDLSAKSVANLDIKLLIATIAWTLHIKADIHL